MVAFDVSPPHRGQVFRLDAGVQQRRFKHRILLPVLGQCVDSQLAATAHRYRVRLHGHFQRFEVDLRDTHVCRRFEVFVFGAGPISGFDRGGALAQPLQESVVGEDHVVVLRFPFGRLGQVGRGTVFILAGQFQMGGSAHAQFDKPRFNGELFGILCRADGQGSGGRLAAEVEVNERLARAASDGRGTELVEPHYPGIGCHGHDLLAHVGAAKQPSLLHLELDSASHRPRPVAGLGDQPIQAKQPVHQAATEQKEQQTDEYGPGGRPSLLLAGQQGRLAAWTFWALPRPANEQQRAVGIGAD